MAPALSASLQRFTGLATETELLDWACVAALQMLDKYPALAEKHVHRWPGSKAEYLKA